FRPSIENLEGRITPSTFVWRGDMSNAYNDSSNWRIGGVVATTLPGQGDTIQFDSTAVNDCLETSTEVVGRINTTAFWTHSLTIGGTLEVSGSLGLAASSWSSANNILLSTSGTRVGTFVLNQGATMTFDHGGLFDTQDGTRVPKVT